MSNSELDNLLFEKVYARTPSKKHNCIRNRPMRVNSYASNGFGKSCVCSVVLIIFKIPLKPDCEMDKGSTLVELSRDDISQLTPLSFRRTKSSKNMKGFNYELRDSRFNSHGEEVDPCVVSWFAVGVT